MQVREVDVGCWSPSRLDSVIGAERADALLASDRLTLSEHDELRDLVTRVSDEIMVGVPEELREYDMLLTQIETSVISYPVCRREFAGEHGRVSGQRQGRHGLSVLE